MQLAPIIIFTYRRIATLEVLVRSLLNNPEAADSEVYFFCDGSKGAEDAADVEEVQNFVKQLTGFGKIHIHFSEVNKGLAASVISGVSAVFEVHEKAIVVEDDLEVSVNFLSFMNQALVRYSSEKKVYSISGYCFDLNVKSAADVDAYFLNRGWSWTWATWRDRWALVDWEVQDYAAFQGNKFQRKAFSALGSDVNSMLDRQMSGQIDSWAIRWVYQQFKAKGLTLYPKVSKVYNHGFDAVATHNVGSSRRYITFLDKSTRFHFEWPKDVAITEKYQRAFLRKMSIPQRILSRLESLWVQFKRKWG